MLEGTLCVLLVLTNIFWAWITHKLVNKLMSRNYGEYQEFARIQPRKENNLKPPEGFYPEDLGALHELQS